MRNCKFIHYEIDNTSEALMNSSADNNNNTNNTNTYNSNSTMNNTTDNNNNNSSDSKRRMEAEWIKCDVRKIDMTVLGKFSVIMADPPWHIQMNVSKILPVSY